MGLIDLALYPCPDGHGPMQKEPGFWALQGVQRSVNSLLDTGTFSLSGDGMVLKVWTCPKCKLVRLYADDQD